MVEARAIERTDAPSARVGDDGRARLAAASGVLGALAASACCLLPLALFSLGVGGVWVGRLAGLSPYQPWFIGVAALAIGYGFWVVYARPRRTCTTDGACARPVSHRLAKTALWSATALTVAAVAWPYAATLLL